MNKHEQRPHSFICVRKRSVTCSSMFVCVRYLKLGYVRLFFKTLFILITFIKIMLSTQVCLNNSVSIF
ncbi:hypothetical protein Hanom_Chr14g01327011 [Helianthus anomalus]